MEKIDHDNKSGRCSKTFKERQEFRTETIELEQAFIYFCHKYC